MALRSTSACTVVLASLLGCAALAGCNPSECLPGDMRSCTCPEGATGVQRCTVAGVFPACSCALPDAGPLDAAIALDAPDAPRDDAPTLDGEAADAVVDDATTDGDIQDAGDLDDATADAPLDDAGPAPMGHIVLIGHPTLRPDDAVDPMVVESVLLSARANAVRVLDYTEYLTSPGGDMLIARLHSAIDARATGLGRSVTYTSLTNATGLAAALAGADVLLIHPQFTATEAGLRTTAAFWHDPLVAFVESGGVVVVTPYTTASGGGAEHELVAGTGLLNLPMRTVPAPPETLTVVAASDPIVAGVLAPYPSPLDGTHCYPGSTGGAVVVRTTTTLCPVVRHLVIP